MVVATAMAAAASSMYDIIPQPMLGCVLEIICVENLIRVTEALILVSMQRLSGFDQSLVMDIGVEESQECLPLLKVDRPCIGGDLIDGSDSRNTVPYKSSPTSFEGEECKDAGSDDDEDDNDEDDDDEDDDDDDAGGDEEDDLSGDEGGQGDQANNPDEEGDEEANGNDEEDDDEDDDDDDEEEDDDDEEEDDDEEDEEPPAKKKK